MTHSTVECSTVWAMSRFQTAIFSTFLFLTMTFGGALTSFGQSLSSDASYIHHPTTPVKAYATDAGRDVCPGAPVIEQDDWAFENSSGSTDFEWLDHTIYLGASPNGCVETIWTGGYNGGPNVLTATQTISFPDDAGLGLCFEYFSLLVDPNTDGTDYSFISIDGNEVFVIDHISENNTEAYLPTCLDVSEFAGQTVEVVIGNVYDGDGETGNVAFGCFAFSCGEFTPQNDLCENAIAIECGASITGSTALATFDDNAANADNCGTSVTASGVWYSLSIGDDAQIVDVTTCEEDYFYDSKISVFTGSCDALVCVGGNDDDISCDNVLQSRVVFTAESNTDYLVLVHGFAGATGDFTLSLSCELACEPTISIECPADADLACDADFSVDALGFPTVEASDCVGEIELSHMDDVVSDGSCPTIIARTWIATDGETTEMCTQTITLTDNEAPVWNFFPEDFSVSCEEASNIEELVTYYQANYPLISADDNCSFVTYEEEIDFNTDVECPNVAICTKTITASDECGNSISDVFVVTIYDNTAPVIIDFEEEVTVECLEEANGPYEYTAIDECSGLEVEVLPFSSNTGEIIEECDLSTAFGPGDDWALWLPQLGDLGLAESGNFVFDADGGSFDQYADGTAHLYGTVVNEFNAAQSFDVDFWFENKADWTDWSDAGRGYKDDLGCAQPDLYEAWTYYEMVNGISNMTGLDAYAGSHLSFYHMPDSYYFGFQIGEGANNKNCGYGMSGWFTFDGLLNGEAVEGHGDVNVDAECTPVNLLDCIHDTEFTYLYRVEDACGNTAVYEQTEIVHDETAPEFTVFPMDVTVQCDEYPVAIAEVEAEDNCTGDVIITGPVDVMHPGECDNSFVVERTWTVSDICDNIHTQTQTIIVIDTTAPEFEGLPEAEVTVQCDAVPAAPEVTVSDNCSAVEDIFTDYEETVTPGDCPGNYTITRDWHAEDECGNENSFTQTITVEDTTAPVFDDYVYYTSLNCEEVEGFTLTATDNCGEATVVILEEQLNSGGCMGVLYRLYQAEDECGNVSAVEQYITILDNQGPDLVNIPEDTMLECSDVNMLENGNYFFAGDVYGEDNCALEVTIEYSEETQDDGDNCDASFIIVRTWVGTDYCGNMSEGSQTVTVVDTTNPEWDEFPMNLELECSDAIPAPMFPTAEDNCDNDVEIDLIEEEFPGSCPGEFELHRTFRAFDDCGNEIMQTQILFFNDNTPPVFANVPAAATYECNTPIDLVLPTADDNCSSATITHEDGPSVDGDCPQEYSFTRTFYAMDECGNTSSATQEINVVDNTAPVFDAYEALIEMSCDAVEIELLTATDNCGDVEVSYTSTPFSGFCEGNIILDWVAVDECGNESYAQQTVTLIDNVDPEFTAFPIDAEVSCDEVPAPSEMVDAEDNCDDEVEITYEGENIIPGNCPGNYTIERTWSAEDNCENIVFRTQVINVVDLDAPEFTYVPEGYVISCDQELELEDATAEDNCSGATVTVSSESTPGDCPNESTIVRTFTATDLCGNEATATQTIQVIDDVDPVFTMVPGPASYSCDEEVPATMAEAMDSCGDVTVSHSDEIIAGDCPQAYTIVRTFTAVDACNNDATAEQLISVYDNTAPVFDDYEMVIEITCSELNETIVTATDNCDPNVEVYHIDTEVSGNCEGGIIRDWYAVDACGNEATTQQIIQLVDDVDPMFTLFPADASAPCYDVPAVSDAIAADDNCDTDVTITYLGEEIIPGDCDGNYTIVRTWSAEDNCENIIEASQTIEIFDNEAPEFTFVPEGYTAECNAIIELEDATAEDLCSGATVSVSTETIPGTCPNESTIIRTFTAVDGCGNEAEATQTIEIVDTQAPFFTFVPQPANYECGEEAELIMATASDLCGEATVSHNDVMIPGECEGQYSIERTFTATDACGLTAQAVSMIFFDDNTAPVFDPYEAIVSVNCGEIIDITITAQDACSNATVTFEDTPFSGECGNIVRDYTAVDACGNEATAQQIIQVVDNIAPIFTNFPANEVVECPALPEVPTVLAEDNCASDIEVEYLGEELTLGSCLGEFTLTRTWYAEDNCGNSVEQSQTIEVTDNTAPIFTYIPEGYTAECNEELELEDALAIDLCSVATVSVSSETLPGDCPNESTIVRTFTATDLCGNFTTAEQVIEIVDTQAPFFLTVPSPASYSCEETIEEELATAADACGDATVTYSDVITPGECPNEYTITRTFLATDACGLTAEASTTIEVYDNSLPVFDDVVENVMVECSFDVPATPELTATDNCGLAIVSVDSEILEMDECGNYIEEVTYTATDACGNMATTSYTISVYDNTAPVLVGTPEAELIIDCDASIPAPAEVTALDNCEGELVTSFTETIHGDLPEEGSVANCNLLNPEPVDGDELCTGEAPWAVKMFDFMVDGNTIYFQSIDGDLVEYDDNTATLTATVVSATNPNAGFEVAVLLENGMGWEDWSTQDFFTWFKDDCNAADDNYLDWTYYIMSSASTLTGWGDYEGSLINLAHAPSSHLYGYQVGVAANNVNNSFGNGGWFTYSGVFVDASTQSFADVEGSGDFAFDQDCCPDYFIERSWCAEDCTGNDVCFTQFIYFGEAVGFESIEVELDGVTETSKGGDELAVVTAYPNPAIDKAYIEFQLKEATSARLEVFNLSGAKVADLFNAEADANETYKVEFNAQELPVGIYVYRLTTENNIFTNRIIINK